MAKDFYKILGVEKNASQDEIKKAFRKLAHQYHPDKNKGDDSKFKEVNEAYTVLSDEKKRKQYDMYGNADTGFGGFNGAQGFGGFDFSQFNQNGQSFEFDLGDVFNDFFGGARRPRKGRNITIDIQLTFKEAAFGTEREISNGKEKITVKIPSGINNGEGLRVSGKGETGEAGPGDLIVRIWVAEHKTLRREGYNVITEVKVKLSLALLGGPVNVESLDGNIEVQVPQGVTPGEMLRIKGKGIQHENGKRGDMYVAILIDIPRKLSKSATKLVEELKKEGI
ncbi:MAG: DnaJ domain-containing protein [Candidatus Pacebacteria bacterium]|nr:DnaJ domain-containing protein [Candidatus Paceibacterota bacterium]